MPFLNNSLTRRTLMLGSAATAGALMGGWQARGTEIQRLHLATRETSYAFHDQRTSGLVSSVDNGPPPVIRLRQGKPVVIDVMNGLDEYTSMHWHGIRLPNEMDGVPYLTQLPMMQHETFRYEFTPPDAGTYWYHPHCMTMRQMAHGMTGVLIVEEENDLSFDGEVVLNLKDFRIKDDGALLPYYTKRGAARGGTFGNVRTANWQVNPHYDVAAGGMVRLRIAATDTTRVYRLTLPDVQGRIIAWDGHPLREDMPWPSEEKPLWLGPGQRVDIALIMPEGEGALAKVVGQFGASQQPMATLRAVGSSLKRSINDLPVLPPNPLTPPELDQAETHEFVFGWSPDGTVPNNGFCGTLGFTFWSINRKAWPGDASPNVGPLLDMKLGRSYILRLRNESPNLHPIHLHGLAFLPLRSNLRPIQKNWTDTMLLLKNEVVDVALNADNPGDWAFHCHVIEHQKTGLSGFIRVS